MDKEISNTASSTSLFIVVGIAVISAGISIFFYFYKFGFGLWNKASEWASLGDFFGGVLNPIFAFASLILLLLTLKQNQKALSQNEKALLLNNKELELTRNELSSSKIALERQATIQEKQNFEGTFFNLVNIHQDLLNSIDLGSDKHGDTRGRDCFKVFYHRFKSTCNVFTEKRELINSKYMNFHEKHQSEIGHYFRSLYNIVKFIHGSNIEDKQLYMNILRAQLSTYELALLFYNSISDIGVKNFKPYIEKYGLLKGVPFSLIIGNDKARVFYSESAFNEIAL